ncbi:hypothetical protein F2Q68_00017609 [Brassica cretica]|uniref:Uncharacterized protein n=1 Tax=Brassica cretica TaxID=69181 RepID=A0A8S9HHB5_BRACR|nr:hypothetical protein F2Q68_00017609 [Brassica cretica]
MYLLNRERTEIKTRTRKSRIRRVRSHMHIWTHKSVINNMSNSILLVVIVRRGLPLLTCRALSNIVGFRNIGAFGA